MSKKSYKHLNQTERFYISKRLQAGDNEFQIAKDRLCRKVYSSDDFVFELRV